MSHPFTRPCILDVKLGTVLYSPEASEEKKLRMKKNAEGTTIATTGMRLTGCQVSLPSFDPISPSSFDLIHPRKSLRC